MQHLNIQDRQYCSYDQWEELYIKGPLSLCIHHSRDYLSLAGLDNREKWRYYVLIEETSKEYIRNLHFLERVIEVLCVIDRIYAYGGVCRPNNIYFPKLILSCDNEIGIRFDHNDSRILCNMFSDKWISQFMIDGLDLNPHEEINIYKAKTYAANYVKDKINPNFIKTELLQRMQYVFPSAMLKVAFIYLFTQNFKPIPLNIKRKCFLKYFKIIMKLEKQQVIDLHLACCLIKLLEEKVNRDLNSLRIYLQGTNEKIRVFYNNYLNYIGQNDCSTINEVTYQLVERIPHVGKYKYLKIFLRLNYSRINYNTYKKWDMSLMANLWQRFPEHSNVQRFTLLNLLNIINERSKKDLQLQQEYKHQEGQIGIIRKVDEFWTIVDAIWPNMINHIFYIVVQIL